jgi:hypothetical protein
VERTVTCFRAEWREREVTCTVPRVTCRVEVTPQKYTALVPVWTDQKRVCTVPTLKPREVEREVTRCQLVPQTVTDPCTGCTYTVCKAVSHVHKVRCTVWDCVPEQREFTVRVCSYRPEERTRECRRLVYDCQPVTVVRKERYCVMVPYEVKVKVPVCCP